MRLNRTSRRKTGSVGYGVHCRALERGPSHTLGAPPSPRSMRLARHTAVSLMSHLITALIRIVLPLQEEKGSCYLDPVRGTADGRDLIPAVNLISS